MAATKKLNPAQLKRAFNDLNEWRRSKGYEPIPESAITSGAASAPGQQADERPWPEAAFHRVTAVEDHELALVTLAAYGLRTILTMVAEYSAWYDDDPDRLNENSVGGLLAAARVCAWEITCVAEELQSDKHGRPAGEVRHG